MRISDLSNVTGIPLSTLKDLRHREILELAVGGFPDDPDEIRRWGSFSAPAAMCIMGADEVRKRYGLSWIDAMAFVKTALDDISLTFEGKPARFFDLAAIDREIWAGRFDFVIDEPSMSNGWNYFYGTLEQIPAHLLSIKESREKAHERKRQRDFTHSVIAENDVSGCLMINASRLCRDFYASAKKHNALRDWDAR